MASIVLPLASTSPSAVADNRKLVRIGGSCMPHVRGEKRRDFSFKSRSSGRITMAVAVNVSRFEGVTMAPPDPILGVSEAFRADTNDLKLNLGVGAYRTEELQPYVLNVVKKAEKLMLEKGENKEYLPIEGLAAFNKVTAELLLGAGNPVLQQGRVATVQGLSGTGSLRLAAAFIQRYFPDAKALISSPTWGNHKNIFNDARVPWSEYRYYDPRTVGLDFDDAATRVKSQLKRLARPMYSNPPVHGARIVANVVGDPTLFNEWKEEMELMAGRIKNVRQRLFDSLSQKDKSGKDWSFILRQIGMFSFTGLNKTQSDNMTNKWHVYMTKDGRISLAGLSLAKCEYLADAIIDSYHNVS
ncbi:hypothetical protein MRB53_013702 [Persea americana]|uniref:Uncharacterized protein n=1 Tax=Persea americana TaxID=3435 RepID=A0ACC2K8Z2_PERAE|nr:hypothetical protein MRB53_013702 [Persea americana]